MSSYHSKGNEHFAKGDLSTAITYWQKGALEGDLECMGNLVWVSNGNPEAIAYWKAQIEEKLAQITV